MTSPDPADAQRRGAEIGARFRARHAFDYPSDAWRWWLLMAAAGSLCLLLAGARLWPADDRWAALGWMLLVMLGAAASVPIPRTTASLAAGDLPMFLVLALYGPAPAVLAAALEGAVGSLRTSSRLTSRVATPAANALAMTAAGALHAGLLAALPGPLVGWPVAAVQVVALAGAALLYCGLSTFLLLKLMHLKAGRALTLLGWFDVASGIGTLQLLSAVLAALLALTLRSTGPAATAVALVLVGLSLLMLRAHFRIQQAQHAAQEARVAAAEAEAQLNQRRFHAAFSRASIGMALVDAEGRIVQANEALHRLLGHADGALVQQPFSRLLHEGDAALLDRHVATLRTQPGEPPSTELRCVAADGSEIWVSLHFAPHDDAGGLIYQLHDISSRREAEGQLRHIAYHDALTDLANRNCFNERLAAAVARHRADARRGFAVMVLDLDRFKLVNDNLGHPAGDRLLKQVAGRLSACLRASDLAARLGGDEFAVLLEEGVGRAEAQALGERLLQTIAQPVRVAGTDVRPQASLGLTLSSDGDRGPEAVLRDADLAMYQSKAAGKGRLTLFSPELHEQLGHPLQLESDLRQAIGEGRLTLAFQPLYALAPHRLVGFEALARWVHPVHGPVSPQVFIKLAEDSGCIEALTSWAVEEAVRQLAQWRLVATEQRDLAVHVNVSGSDMVRPRFVSHVQEVLQRHGVPPRLLLLEVTESTLMERRDETLSTLAALGELGVKLGIDDFGTGYSSLSYLSTLPFDCLKIDRSFVTGMERGPQNVEIVRTVISLGRTLDKQVVAEGVETHEQLRRLRQMGADIGQGFVLSRPLSAQQAMQLLIEPHLVPG